MGTHSQERAALLTDYDPSSKYSAAYHTVFYNIRFNWDSDQFPHYTVLLVPPVGHPGQAIPVANVAIAAAQNGTPTILVDADLQEPGLLQRFGLTPQPGLADLLASDADKSPLSHSLSKTFIPDLLILGAGTSARSAAESRQLLANGLGRVLQELRLFLQQQDNRPGLIIFHSPPVLSGADAALIAAQMDQTFLTIAAGRTTRTQARKAQEVLERAQVNVAGTILLDK